MERTSPEASAVFEAKKGRLVPGEDQLSRYAGRFSSGTAGLLVALSDSSATARPTTNCPPPLMASPVTRLARDDVRLNVCSARAAARTDEKHWLGELATYLSGATSVRDPSEHRVYCVVISSTKPGDGGGRTFRGFATNERVYFHPFGGRTGWPSRPPVLAAFRWGGLARQVNRAMNREVVPNLQVRWPDIPAQPTRIGGND